MKAMMLRPDVLRHPGDYAKDKTEYPIEPLSAKETPVAAFVHQDKRAQGE